MDGWTSGYGEQAMARNPSLGPKNMRMNECGEISNSFRQLLIPLDRTRRQISRNFWLTKLSIKFSCTIPAILGWWVGSIICWVPQEWWKSKALGASIFMFKVRDFCFWVLQGILISIPKSGSFSDDSPQWHNVSKAALHFSNTWHCRVFNLLGAQFLQIVELRFWCLRPLEMVELRFWCLWFWEWQSFQFVRVWFSEHGRASVWMFRARDFVLGFFR